MASTIAWRRENLILRLAGCVADADRFGACEWFSGETVDISVSLSSYEVASVRAQ